MKISVLTSAADSVSLLQMKSKILNNLSNLKCTKAFLQISVWATLENALCVP